MFWKSKYLKIAFLLATAPVLGLAFEGGGLHFDAAHAQYSGGYCSDYARRVSRYASRGGAIGGAVRGSFGGAVFGGIVGGKKGARRGARIGAVAGGVGGGTRRVVSYDVAYRDCMAGYLRY